MLDKQGYGAWLARKKSNEKLIQERLGLLDRLDEVIAKRGITEISGVGDEEIVELCRPWNVSGRRNFLHNIASFLNDYTTYIKKEHPAQKPLADTIDHYYMKGYESAAKKAAQKRCADILPMPEKFKVDPKYLGEMNNDQFVSAFKELHKFVIRCYKDIERAPFEWGYPNYETTDGYYNRVMDILFAFGLCGIYEDGGITVDGAKFFAFKLIKRHKKVELMIAGFEQMGLCFEGFGKKAQRFRIQYPDNPRVMMVLCAYVNNIDTIMPDWAWGKPLNSLTYRYIQDPAEQKFHRIFHAEMDYASDKLREIQEWLYVEAEKYGFSIDPKKPSEKDCILYKKGSKRFLLVNEKGCEQKITTKVSFIHAFEREPDKMRVLCHRFPHVFRLDDPGLCCDDKKRSSTPHMFADNSESSGKRCAFRMKFTFGGVTYKRCGLCNFVFEDISFDDVKVILEMFLLENKIK